MNIRNLLSYILMIAAGAGLLIVIGHFKHPPQPPRDEDGWRITEEESEKPNSRCQAAGFAAYNQCREEFENQWGDEGAVDEPKPQRAVDYDRCSRVEEQAVIACKNYGGSNE
jgi:hypothetical protein